MTGINEPKDRIYALLNSLDTVNSLEEAADIMEQVVRVLHEAVAAGVTLEQFQAWGEGQP